MIVITSGQIPSLPLLNILVEIFLHLVLINSSSGSFWILWTDCQRKNMFLRFLCNGVVSFLEWLDNNFGNIHSLVKSVLFLWDIFINHILLVSAMVSNNYITKMCISTQTIPQMGVCQSHWLYFCLAAVLL